MQPHDAVQSSDRSPVSNLLLQRLGGVGNGLASCGVRDGGPIARLSFFIERPAEAAVAQEIGFNRDRERVIFDHLRTIRPRAKCFPARGSAVNFKLIYRLKQGTLILLGQGISSFCAAMAAPSNL